MSPSKEYRDSHKNQIKAYALKYRLAHGQHSIKKIKVKDNGIPVKSIYIIYCEKCTPLIKGNKSHCIECLEYYRVGGANPKTQTGSES